MDSVTVIIPAYNAEVCLHRCLESIFAQEYPAAQVIVVNDGSTDNTRKITNDYASRVEYYEQENQGPKARQGGFLPCCYSVWILPILREIETRHEPLS